MRYLLLPATIAFLVAAAHSLPGALVITMQEVGPDVVLSASGSLDLAGATHQGSGNATFTRFNTRPSSSRVRVFQSGPFERYEITGGPAAITPSSATASYVGIAYTGDTFGLSGTTFYVPGGYTGGPISGSATGTGTNLAAMGFVPGSYVWTIPSDTITLNVVAASPIPEPSTYLALAGFGGLGLLVWRRRAAKRNAALAEEV